MAACAAGEESAEPREAGHGSERNDAEDLVAQRAGPFPFYGTRAAMLARAMYSYHNVLVLDLYHTAIGPKGWKVLGDFVADPQACSLVSLNLASTKGTTRAAMELAKAMKTNETLVELDLENNPLYDGGVAALASGLFENETLKSLNLNNVYGNDEGTAWLGLLLLRNSTITELKYEWNCCDTFGSTRIADALHRNTALTSLRLAHSLTEHAHADLREAVAHNTTLLDVSSHPTKSYRGYDSIVVQSLENQAAISDTTHENRAALNEAKSRAACIVWCWELLPLTLGLGGVPQDVLRGVVKDVRGDIRVKRLERVKHSLETDTNPAPSKRSRVEGDSA